MAGIYNCSSKFWEKNVCLLILDLRAILMWLQEINRQGKGEKLFDQITEGTSCCTKHDVARAKHCESFRHNLDLVLYGSQQERRGHPHVQGK